MIARSGNGNFLVAHYDWVLAGVGVLALAGAGAYCLIGGNVDEEISAVTSSIEGRRVTASSVEDVNMKAYSSVTNVGKIKLAASTMASKAGSVFASGKRLRCRNEACARVSPAKLDNGNLICSFCGFTQEIAKAVVILDADGDGMPDAWERKHGFNANDPADASIDTDGDEFTNVEEYEAKTDPKDKASHPDYLDSLKIVLPLKKTYMPFVFLSATPIPSGWRCSFFDPSLKDDYGRTGATLTAVIGNEIGKSGFVLKSYEKKSVKRTIKGSVNQKEVDVSEVVVERKSDAKSIVLTVAASKKDKPAPVDIQATLSYERLETKNFNVVPGQEIVLSGIKYKVSAIKALDKGAAVTVEEVLSGKKRTIEALEP